MKYLVFVLFLVMFCSCLEKNQSEEQKNVSSYQDRNQHKNELINPEPENDLISSIKDEKKINKSREYGGVFIDESISFRTR
ncbi:MAG: hypothetical protein HQ541_16955 [Mariniphaga sp.]|nr:hypothetical protein [Mariniphaga sp.]